MQIKARKVEKKKKKKKKNPKIKNGLKKNEKIEMKDQSQENESVTIQEMILGLNTFKHVF